MKKAVTLFAGLLSLLLSSCSIYDWIPGASLSSMEANPEDVLPVALRELGQTTGFDALPSTGDVNLLVLPIQFADQPFASQTLVDIDTAFNGSSDDTGYWESVSSFYEKSSYGQSRLHFTIADPYATSLTQRQAYDQCVTQKDDSGFSLVNEAFLAYKKGISSSALRDFDSDGNGWIDGIVAVYSGKDFDADSRVAAYDKEEFYWAYTTWGYYQDQTGAANPNASSPTPNLYFWLSYDFLYKAVSSPKVDTHALIHEMGHMYGLDDYYSAKDNGPSYAGGWDMMDLNILDHDAYSKMMLGWLQPQVVSGVGTYTIGTSEEDADALLIPSSTWNGSAYDEYMLLELYTPTGLNYLDSHKKYTGRGYGYSTYGVKLYHIDSRILQIKQHRTTLETTYSYLRDPRKVITQQASGNYVYGYEIGQSNLSQVYGGQEDCVLIHMMEATGRSDFDEGSRGSVADLFETGDSWSLSAWGDCFPCSGSWGKVTMDNGDSFPYQIRFSSVSATSATIQILSA